MTSCVQFQMMALMVFLLMNQGVCAFTLGKNSAQQTAKLSLKALPEKVEVCGFKDCRRAGGGAKLEKLVSTVLEENNLLDSVKVQDCECQGECGYGPNLVIDGKIANFVKGKDAVIKALRLEEELSGLQVHSFATSMNYSHKQNNLSVYKKLRLHELCMKAQNDDFEGDNSNGDDEEIIESNQDEPTVINDLDWRVEKLRLEEANTRRFLKSGPRFLPYEECRKWVKAWNRWETEEDWKNWIDEGEKRNSYIPARPDEYYHNRGEWKSWEHFLGVEGENDHDDDGGEFQ